MGGKALLFSLWVLDATLTCQVTFGYLIVPKRAPAGQLQQLVVLTRTNAVAQEPSSSITSSSNVGNTSESIRKEEEEEVDATLKMNKQLDQLANQIGATRNRRKKVAFASKAIDIVESAKDPDSVTYNTLLKVLAKTSPLSIDQRPAATHARMVLDRMKKIHEQQKTANQAWYNQALAPADAASTLESVDQGPPVVRIKPNVRSYSTVMDALAHEATTEAALQTEELLDELEERCGKNGWDFALQPNDFVYNAIVSAWAKAGNVENCLEWLHRIENHKTISPGTHTYNNVLNVLAKAGKAAEAESMLRNMSLVSPNVRSYTICMNAWAHLGNPERVQKLLMELKEEHKKSGGRRDLMPNTISYSALIQAYARSNRIDKASKAQQVLRDMEAEGIKPNSWTYNKLLNCYALSCPANSNETTGEKLTMIKAAYQKLVDSGNISTTTIGTVLKACENLLLYDIDPDFCCSVFQDAADHGLVSSWVLTQFYAAVPIEVFRNVVPLNDYKEWDQLPDGWTRRAKEEG